MSGNVGVIGRAVRSTVTVGIPASDLDRLFAPVAAAVQQADPANRPAAEQVAQDLKAEAGKGKQADDTRLAKLVRRIGWVSARSRGRSGQCLRFAHLGWCGRACHAVCLAENQREVAGH